MTRANRGQLTVLVSHLSCTDGMILQPTPEESNLCVNPIQSPGNDRLLEIRAPNSRTADTSVCLNRKDTLLKIILICQSRTKGYKHRILN